MATVARVEATAAVPPKGLALVLVVSVVSVRKAIVRPEAPVSVPRESNRLVAGHHAHKASVVRHGQPESVVSVRKGSGHHGQQESVHRVHQLNRHRQFPRLQQLRRHHHRRPSQLRMPLRASRGDSKPCYWHRHVQSTADNIAVA